LRCDRKTAAALAAIGALAGFFASARLARADANDYRPENDGWNGLSAFCALARGMGLQPLAVSTLAWDDLRPGDVLFIVYPRGQLSPDHLVDFVKAAGLLF